MAPAATAAALDLALSRLTEVLPALPPDELTAHAATARGLAEACPGPVGALAASLAAVLVGYVDGLVPAEGWGLVASCAHTLARALAEPDGGHGGAALTAARFELDSLRPSGGPPPPVTTGPDVALTSLRRRS